MVIGDENGESILVAEFANDLVDFLNGNGVDADEGFVEKKEAGFGAEAAGQRESALLTAGESEGERLANVADAKSLEKFVSAIVACFAAHAFACFEDGEEVVLDAEFSKD